MNNKGFSLIELLGSLVLLTIILGIGLFMAKDTLSTSILTIDKITEKEIIDTAKQYVLENNVKWKNDLEEYTCIKISTLADYGYFNNNDIKDYNNMFVKIVRNKKNMVITNSTLVDICE